MTNEETWEDLGLEGLSLDETDNLSASSDARQHNIQQENSNQKGTPADLDSKQASISLDTIKGKLSTTKTKAVEVIDSEEGFEILKAMKSIVSGIIRLPLSIGRITTIVIYTATEEKRAQIRRSVTMVSIVLAALLFVIFLVEKDANRLIEAISSLILGIPVRLMFKDRKD